MHCLNSMDLRSYLFGGFTRQAVYKSLDASAMRDRAISQNLANVSTPGYRRKEVSFEEELKKVMELKLTGKTTDPAHLEISKLAELKKTEAYVYEANDPTLPGEVNNVDVDIEASKMAENQIFYNYTLKFAGFNGFNAAITGQPSQ